MALFDAILWSFLRWDLVPPPDNIGPFYFERKTHQIMMSKKDQKRERFSDAHSLCNLISFDYEKRIKKVIQKVIIKVIQTWWIHEAFILNRANVMVLGPIPNIFSYGSVISRNDPSDLRLRTLVGDWDFAIPYHQRHKRLIQKRCQKWSQKWCQKWPQKWCQKWPQKGCQKWC